MKLKPEDIPHNFIHCFATDGQCPKRRECLRALAAGLPLKTPHNHNLAIRTTDPRYIATLHGGENCLLFRSSAPKRYARGMSRMYDEVPGKVSAELRRLVQCCFSCRSYYFSSRKGERLISPEEQNQIAAVFRRLCPNIQPAYDEFEDTYDW